MIEVQVSSSEQATVVKPIGRIDQATTAAFQERLLEQVERMLEPRIVLDFSEVNYISSIGLRAIMIGAKNSKEKGGEQVVAGLGETVAEIFRIARFDAVIRVFATVDDALQGLQGV